MPYSRLQDIGFSKPVLENFYGDDEELPIVTVSSHNKQPRNIIKNNEVTSLATLYHKTMYDNENRALKPHLEVDNRYVVDPQLEIINSPTIEPLLLKDNHISEHHHDKDIKCCTDIKCTDIFEHIQSCKVCSQLYNEYHGNCKTCNNSHSPTIIKESKSEYKNTCVILGCICIILFLIILKLLISKTEE